MSKEKILIAIRIILVISILATVAFIFSNSMKTPEKSSEQSSAVMDAILSVIPDTPETRSFLEDYLRKIAHFTEYGLLGIEMALLCLVSFDKKRKYIALSLLLSFLVAFLDESVQGLFDRGSSIDDVWIDVGGFVFFSLITYLAYALIALCIYAFRRYKKKRRETNG